jgi:UDP-glucose 4-epimerase
VKILVTGISGFIGGSFGRYAAGAGHTVIGAGRSTPPVEGWTGIYTPARGTTELVNVIREFQPDVVLHAAGTASVSASIDDPLTDFRGSVATCADLLDAVRQSGSNPLILITSSAAVYGNPAVLPVPEEAALAPISPYGFHKLAAELLAREYAECFGLRTVICRFFSVFGFSQRRLLVWELYNQLAGGDDTVWLAGTGEETRDFLYIDDLASALLGLSEKFQNTDSDCVIVNVATGVETSVLTLAQTIRDLVAPEKVIRCRGLLRKNDPLRWCADISRVRQLLPSWKPRSLANGLSLSVAAWQQMERSSVLHGS